jgi:hypothetical protein
VLEDNSYLMSFEVSIMIFLSTYPSKEEGSAARHNDDETSAVAESMPMRFTAVIMF